MNVEFQNIMANDKWYFKRLWLANDKWRLKCILHYECGYFKTLWFANDEG